MIPIKCGEEVPRAVARALDVAERTEPNCLYPENACEYMLNNGNCGTQYECLYKGDKK